jgi:hypothetical protein
MVQEAVEKATETRQVLRRIQEHQSQAQNAAERTNRRMTYQKLSDNLAITARVLEDVVRRFTAEEQTRRMATPRDPIPVEAGSDRSAGGLAAADVAGGDDSVIPGNSSGNSESRPWGGVRRGDEDVTSLQRIYTDLANTAEEQQPTFETLESHIVDMASDIERGRGEEIPPTWGKYAANTEAARRRRLILLAGGAMSFFGLTIWFTA